MQPESCEDPQKDHRYRLLLNHMNGPKEYTTTITYRSPILAYAWNVMAMVLLFYHILDSHLDYKIHKIIIH